MVKLQAENTRLARDATAAAAALAASGASSVATANTGATAGTEELEFEGFGEAPPTAGKAAEETQGVPPAVQTRGGSTLLARGLVAPRYQAGAGYVATRDT